jgi:beta-galactosidase
MKTSIGARAKKTVAPSDEVPGKLKKPLMLETTYPVSGSGIPCSFGYSDTDFLIDGHPIQIFSGELHYFRVPRPYWQDRLAKAKAMGLNAVCTYMPWNLHEPSPGQFDFSGDNGMLDIASFIRMAGEMGLWVLLRPGPYICAEWDFGGLPGWLLADRDVRIRCSDEKYLTAVERYITRVGQELSHLTCGNGGPIGMVQVENEYGSFANDRAYLYRLRQMLTDAGLGDGTLYFTSDGAQSDMLAAGTLDGTLVTANFGSKADVNLTKLREFRPHQPIMCGEFWCGWFDQWGKPRQGNDDPTVLETDVRWMVENNASFSIYMFHGGTNFGFTAGANHYEDFAPTVTGYDYWALLDEAGRPTRKYDAVRRILGDQSDLPPIPANASAVVEIPADRFRFTGSASLWTNLPKAIHSPSIKPMEQVGQYLGGAILYRTNIKGLGAGKLNIVEPHDVAQVYLDGVLVATLDRQHKQTTVELPEIRVGAKGQMDILVWALGHVNYGPKMLDYKGISDRVEFKHFTLTGWEICPMPMDAAQRATLKYSDTIASGPTYHRAEFTLAEDEVGDTFLDTRAFEIGAIWVNGHNLGRYWSVGPQQTLFCPGCWLRPGSNEIVIFDMASTGRPTISGSVEAVLNEVPT